MKFYKESYDEKNVMYSLIEDSRHLSTSDTHGKYHWHELIFVFMEYTRTHALFFLTRKFTCIYNRFPFQG